MSLSHDCLYFELIGYCTGYKHKRVMVGNSVLLTGMLAHSYILVPDLWVCKPCAI